ncbi:MAG: right-handed parallel beta-helix repeat-containing protein [Phycisphaerales bacterium]|nr:right-handed parallel beta-helix repeat-containing protein [Phycisphaerales bacterium]
MAYLRIRATGVLPGVVVLGLFAMTTDAAVIRVNAAAPSGGDGSSWATALNDLQAALTAAQPGDEIWVQQGVYKPHPTNRSISFNLKNGVALYGGFTGVEESLLQRNPALTSTLSGEIGTGSTTDNSYHVVRAESVDASAVLDGFTVTAGYAGGGLPTDAVFGGGLYVRNASPTLRGLIVSNNSASDTGGGMFIAHGTLLIERCFFFGNRGIASGGKGGAIGVGSASITLVNCVFANNFTFSPSGGGAIHLTNTNLVVLSSTFNNNSASAGSVVFSTNFSTATFSNSVLAGTSGAGVFFGGTTPTVNYSIVQGGFPGTGNLSAAPTFVNAPAANFRLAPGSSGIDTGSNAAVSTIAADFDLNPRVLNGTTDMGAYEFVAKTCAGDLNKDGFVDDSDFVLFADAYNNLLDRRGDFTADLLTDDSDFVIFADAYNALLCP